MESPTANGGGKAARLSFHRPVRVYLAALRPWSFAASCTPVALGSAVAFKVTGQFSLAIFILVLAVALSVHAAGNLVNTYFDFMRGVDRQQSSDDRTLVDAKLTPNDVAWLGGCFYFVGCVFVLLLACCSPAREEHLALVYFGGLSASFMYTGGLGLKFIALGDIVIFLTFGPLTVLFAYLAQTGSLSLVSLPYALPLALNIEAVLHANNVRDMASDREAGIVTLALVLGEALSYALFTLLLFAPYVAFLIVTLHWSKWFILPSLTIVKAFGIEKRFRAGILRGLPVEIASLNVLLGATFVVACLISNREDLPWIRDIKGLS